VATERKLSDPSLYANAPERFQMLTAELATLRAKLEETEMRWLEVAEKAEALAG